MKVLAVILTGACLLALSQASPTADDHKDNEIGNYEIPTSIIAEEELTHHHQDLTPHSREKRSKKVIIINRYYVEPTGYGGYQRNGPRGGYGGYQRGGYDGYPGNYGGYPSYGYDDDYYERDGRGKSGAGKIFKKLKKFG